MDTLTVVQIEQQDPRLGRQQVHDERSRAFPLMVGAIDRSLWKSRLIRIYDPTPNPNQEVGCCTGTSKCTQFNASFNRKTGQVLKMDTALKIYSANTKIDPWPGEWPPEDTGSSALASCKTAQSMGLGGEYRWLFGGADEVVQAIMNNQTISIGSWWYWDMFEPDATGLVRPTGGKAGGHQYIARGYIKSTDEVVCRNWWGDYRDFKIKRDDLNALIMDGGDAHFQKVIV